MVVKSQINQAERDKLIDYLFQFITPERKNRFEEIIQYRTRFLTVVLEDIFQSHNISAVLRSCDCFGVQDVHIIENKNQFQINPDIALGASKWLTLHQHNKDENNTLSCIKALKTEGYRIISTSPHKNDVNLEELAITEKTALLFGTELNGISETAVKYADGFVKIPMVGFTESFNISVSVALCLFNLTDKIRKSNVNWKLSENERSEIMLEWLRNTIQSVDAIEKKYFIPKI
jgi:tRNA (guanosine-2'-O-)-methyltransferase